MFNTKHPDYNLLLKEPAPFEMDLPWGDPGFSSRFHNVVHSWGIPTEKEVAFLISYLEFKKARILDLACGGGRHSFDLAKLGHDVTGIDIGSFPIEFAKGIAAEHGLKVNFLQDDILKLDCKSKFDLAFLICGQLGHFSPGESQVIFRNASRSLVDDGIFVVHLPAFGNEDKSSYTQWYREKKPFYFEHQAIVHREQYFLENERVKLIRDFAIDSVTRVNRLFGISEKNYSHQELELFAQNSGFRLKEYFGDYDKAPPNENSPEEIYVFAKQRLDI